MAQVEQDKVEQIAGEFGLPVKIVKAVIEVESGGQTGAYRYEDGFYKHYIEPMKNPPRPSGCSIASEKMGRATSWGPMQIMGETARANGFEDWFPDLCGSEGVVLGCKFLKRLWDKYGMEGAHIVLTAWNRGPGLRHELNGYSDKVLSAAGGSWE